jgi:hypothetical protein
MPAVALQQRFTASTLCHLSLPPPVRCSGDGKFWVKMFAPEFKYQFERRRLTSSILLLAWQRLSQLRSKLTGLVVLPQSQRTGIRANIRFLPLKAGSGPNRGIAATGEFARATSQHARRLSH